MIIAGQSCRDSKEATSPLASGIRKADEAFASEDSFEPRVLTMAVALADGASKRRNEGLGVGRRRRVWGGVCRNF
jgi:Mg-chelatase subunit ChlD